MKRANHYRAAESIMVVLSRSVDKIVFSRAQSEGAGATVRRTIGTPGLPNFDPFLMLDEFTVGLPGGFPAHPHRGFSTVTYLLDDSAGSIVHKDFAGHAGTINAGEVQWMVAGKGIVHSEMPVSALEAHGLQLWVNLPATDKMTAPTYQELQAKDVVKVTKDGVTASIIAGSALGQSSPVKTNTPVYYSHFSMQPLSKLSQSIPTTFAAFIYALKGEATVGHTEAKVTAHHVATLDKEGDGIVITAGSDGFDFVLVSGEPINETVVQHGPIVMNTKEEIR